MLLLEQSKTVVESMQNLILSAKDAGGSRKVSRSFEYVTHSFSTLEMLMMMMM